jgi:hypothetical protein
VVAGAVATTVRRRVVVGLLAWLAGLGAAVAVAHPESCPAPTTGATTDAVRAAVGWIAANQAADGAFLYRYDRDTSSVLPGYNIVRHAGTLLALEQARGAGVTEATDVAERAFAWAARRETDLDGDRTALTGDTGATALLVAALVERRRIDGPTVAGDEHLRHLGRFLAGAVTDDGAVVARWDLDSDEPIAGSRSPYFTGEVLWALSRLHAELPAEGWDEPARRISRYLATERDDAERRFPPVSDHWGSYAFAEMAAWPDAPTDGVLSEDELAYARRQAGLFGVKARFVLQQRRSGIVRLTRGPGALTAGIGTVGEGLGGVWRLAREDLDLDVDRDVVADRLACVAGVLVERQVHSTDPALDGAWFRLGITQVDDEQHAISALLAALPVLEARP